MISRVNGRRLSQEAAAALINKLCPVDDGRAAEQKPFMKKVNVVFTLRGG